MSRYKRTDRAFQQHIARLADIRRVTRDARRRFRVPFWLYMVAKVIFLARIILRLVGAM